MTIYINDMILSHNDGIVRTIQRDKVYGFDILDDRRTGYVLLALTERQIQALHNFLPSVGVRLAHRYEQPFYAMPSCGFELRIPDRFTLQCMYHSGLERGKYSFDEDDELIEVLFEFSGYFHDDVYRCKV